MNLIQRLGWFLWSSAIHHCGKPVHATLWPCAVSMPRPNNTTLTHLCGSFGISPDFKRGSCKAKIRDTRDSYTATADAVPFYFKIRPAFVSRLIEFRDDVCDMSIPNIPT